MYDPLLRVDVTRTFRTLAYLARTRADLLLREHFIKEQYRCIIRNIANEAVTGHEFVGEATHTIYATSTTKLFHPRVRSLLVIVKRRSNRTARIATRRLAKYAIRVREYLSTR